MSRQKLTLYLLCLLPFTSLAQQEPTPRNQPVMCYVDHIEAAVLFGGYANRDRLNDTWLWDGEWRQLNLQIVPQARSGHAMTYDSKNHLLYLFGGRGENGLLNDTWVFNGESWKQLETDIAPTPRQSHRIAYDPTENHIYMFGGSGENRDGLSDTWKFDGKNWLEIKSDLKGRLQHTMVFDSSLEGIVVFGGFHRVNNEKSMPTETLLLKNNQWRVLVRDGPAPRDHHASIYDPSRESLIVFGGYAHRTYLGDTWELKDGQWSLIANGGPARSGKPAFFVQKNGLVTLFGGANAESMGLTDFWTFSNQWSKLK